MHLKAAQQRGRQGPGAQEDQAKVQLFHQVLLLEVSAKECDIVQVIPDENIYLKLALLVCLCSSGWIEERQLLGIQPPKRHCSYLLSP